MLDPRHDRGIQITSGTSKMSVLLPQEDPRYDDGKMSVRYKGHDSPNNDADKGCIIRDIKRDSSDRDEPKCSQLPFETSRKFLHGPKAFAHQFSHGSAARAVRLSTHLRRPRKE